MQSQKPHSTISLFTSWDWVSKMMSKLAPAAPAGGRWKDALPAVESRGSKETLFFASSLHLTDSFTDLVIFESKLLLNFLLWTSHLRPIHGSFPKPSSHPGPSTAQLRPWPFFLEPKAALEPGPPGFKITTSWVVEKTSHHTTNVVVSWVAVQQGVTCWVLVSKDSQQKNTFNKGWPEGWSLHHLSSFFTLTLKGCHNVISTIFLEKQESRIMTKNSIHQCLALLLTFFLYKPTRFIRSLVVYPKIYDGKLYVVVTVGFLKGQQYQPTNISSRQIQWVFVTASWNVSICLTFCVTITCTCSDL